MLTEYHELDPRGETIGDKRKRRILDSVYAHHMIHRGLFLELVQKDSL